MGVALAGGTAIVPTVGDAVSLDADSPHHLEISTSDLVHHLGAVGAPRPR